MYIASFLRACFRAACRIAPIYFIHNFYKSRSCYHKLALVRGRADARYARLRHKKDVSAATLKIRTRKTRQRRVSNIWCEGRSFVSYLSCSFYRCFRSRRKFISSFSSFCSALRIKCRGKKRAEYKLEVNNQRSVSVSVSVSVSHANGCVADTSTYISTRYRTSFVVALLFVVQKRYNSKIFSHLYRALQ